jgi:nucleoside-diphosphate-sugar epimerase
VIGNSRKNDKSNYFVDQLIIDYGELDTAYLSSLKIEHIIFCAGSSAQFNQYNEVPVNVDCEIRNFDLFVKRIVKIPTLKQFIFMSSAVALYESNQIVTELSKLNISTPYANLKHESEKILLDAALKYNFGLKILRLSNIYGPTPNLKISGGFLNTLINCALNNKSFTLDTNYKEIRKNFFYINDFVKILGNLISNFTNNQIVINVADENSYTLHEVVSIAEKVFSDYNLNINYRTEDLNYIGNVNHVYDLTLLSQFSPSHQCTPIDRGIESTLKSFFSKDID